MKIKSVLQKTNVHFSGFLHFRLTLVVDFILDVILHVTKPTVTTAVVMARSFHVNKHGAHTNEKTHQPEDGSHYHEGRRPHGVITCKKYSQFVIRFDSCCFK